MNRKTKILMILIINLKIKMSMAIYMEIFKKILINLINSKIYKKDIHKANKMKKLILNHLQF
jgi:hypothetical protein